jgi:hypothetical protein
MVGQELRSTYRGSVILYAALIYSSKGFKTMKLLRFGLLVSEMNNRKSGEIN